MAKVTGIGGIFFKAKDPTGIMTWYKEHLGVPVNLEYGYASFPWQEPERPETAGETAWTVMAADTDYFDPSAATFMINYRVDDLDALLANLEAAGVSIDPNRQNEDYGKFAWIYDPEGNKIELWEPPKGSE